jgi:hypothetical protein
LPDPFDAEVEQYLIRSVLLIDGDAVSSGRMARVMSEIRAGMSRKDGAAPIVDATVRTLTEARDYLATQRALIVIIDPETAAFAESIAFIEEMRNSHPHLIWTLYCHDHWWNEHTPELSTSEFGRRVLDYFAITKSHPDEQLHRDVLALLVKCQADFALQLLMETIGDFEHDSLTVPQKAKFVDKATKALTLLMLDQAKPRPGTRTAFVSMPFDDAHRELYRYVIAPTLKKQNLTPVMMEEFAPGDPVAVAAFREIGLAEVVVCDLTDGSPNVLFELGVAYRAGKRVVRIASKARAPQELPFMIGGDSILLYDNKMDLESRLPEAIRKAKPWTPPR